MSDKRPRESENRPAERSVRGRGSTDGPVSRRPNDEGPNNRDSDNRGYVGYRVRRGYDDYRGPQGNHRHVPTSSNGSTLSSYSYHEGDARAQYNPTSSSRFGGNGQHPYYRRREYPSCSLPDRNYPPRQNSSRNGNGQHPYPRRTEYPSSSLPNRSHPPRDRPNVRSEGQNSSRNEDMYSYDGRRLNDPSQDRQDQEPTHFEGSSAATVAETVEKQPRSQKSLIAETLSTIPNYVNNKHGTHGREVDLLTNYFKIIKKPTWQLYQYRVDFSPDVELRGLKNRLIYEHRDSLGHYLFDGTILVLQRKLERNETVFAGQDKNSISITITVKFTGTVPPKQSDFILNTIFRKSMSTLGLVLVRRNFYDPKAKIELRRDLKLQLWPGYITSIRQHESDILLCVEITTKVMRTETVYDLLLDSYNRRGDYKTDFESTVIGMTVLTLYNNKMYRITGVDWDRNASSTFDLKGEKTTFVEYYKSRYNSIFQDTKQPLLISKASDRERRAGRSLLIALIPQLCRPTSLGEDTRSNPKVMRDLATAARQSPRERINKLRTFNERLQNEKSETNFQNWNMQLDRHLLNVTGRCLHNERIIFGNNKTFTTDRKVDWTTAPQNNSMYLSKHLTNWAIIVPPKFRETEKLITSLNTAGQGMRYNISRPKIVDVAFSDNVINYLVALKQAFIGNPQLIMCVVSDQNKDRYSAIKKECSVLRGIPTQVITIKTASRQPLLTIATKLLIQINSKLGGVPWLVDINHDDLMVVGYDVCPDTVDKSKTFGAMVATMNMKLEKNYFTVVDELTTGRLLSDQFGLNILKCVSAYRDQRRKLPTKIVIYRDGVGEGQIQYVQEHEIKDIQEKLKPVYEDVPPQLAFIVVSKRINTRFFTRTNENPMPGTVVDNAVTLPQRYEFFLVSQRVNQGTVSPTSYNIIHDDIRFTPDQWQALTYKLTHLYYNWCGTVRVPAVCHNAQRLAFLVANFIHGIPSSNLERQLHFL